MLDHNKEFCSQNKTKCFVIASVSEVEQCPICNSSLYRFTISLSDKTPREIIGSWLSNCLRLRTLKKGNVSKDQIKDIQLCKLCTS